MQKPFQLAQVFVLIYSLIYTPLAFAQTQPPVKQANQPPQTPTKTDATLPEEVVRITTNLIQIDAVVVDKEGKLVADLKPEDFEILEDGKAQKIANFSFISLQAETPKPKPTSAPVAAGAKASPPVPPAPIKPEQVRRTIALIADDLGLSFETTAQTRAALKKFVDEQMQPGDLVAIIRSSAGNGALQQFTNDKRLLHAAIERIQWYPFGRSGIHAFEPMGGRSSLEQLEAAAAITTPSGGGTGQTNDNSLRNTDAVLTNRDPDGEFANSREQIFTVGTIGAMRYVIDGLRELPGRKSVILLSDGVPIFPPIGGIMSDRSSVDRSSRDVVGALRNLTDLANRASVVIYTMDMRGLSILGLSAIDDTQPTFEKLQAAGGQASAVTGVVVNRRNQLMQDYFRTQDGLNYLAAQTGGFFFHDNNNLAGGIQKILDDQRGYYLIGYEPEDTTFNEAGRRTFHKLQVRVKNPNLKVRSRTGFYGIADEEIKKPLATREDQLKAALASPFTSSNLGVTLTSLFGGEQTNQFLRSLIHINARDLTFTKQPNGDYTTVIDIAATTHDENGSTIDRGGRTFTLRVKGTEYETALRDGILYALDVPLKNPGAYQLRLAVRDENSQKLGSATQFIEVPDLKKNQLALSGISLNGSYEKAGRPEYLAQANQALRRLRRGMILNYGYAIYNPKLDSTKQPNLTTQVKLFTNGQEVFAGKESSLRDAQSPNLRQVLAGGAIDLGANLRPGEYVLQVIVKDLLAKEKNRTVSQWMNFEIVN